MKEILILVLTYRYIIVEDAQHFLLFFQAIWTLLLRPRSEAITLPMWAETSGIPQQRKSPQQLTTEVT